MPLGASALPARLVDTWLAALTAWESDGHGGRVWRYPAAFQSPGVGRQVQHAQGGTEWVGGAGPGWRIPGASVVSCRGGSRAAGVFLIFPTRK